MDWWKNKKKKKRALERGAVLLEDIIKCCDGKSNPIIFFSADLIHKATNNFRTRSGLNEFPRVWFSGKTEDDRMILIRFPGYMNPLFFRDVAISSMVSGHKNFMKLVGCCIEFKFPAMVYYGENEQYSKIDFENIVSWKRRMKIAEDIATALAYLHTAFSTPFVYHNMDIANIIIHKDGVAKLIDFSRCISIPRGETFVKVDTFKVEFAVFQNLGFKDPDYWKDVDIGRVRFVDPDYWKNGIVSEKTDTYSFGMCMLMLLNGGNKRLEEFAENTFTPELQIHEASIHYLDWMLQIINECRSVYEMGEVTVEERCSMNAFLWLAKRCVRREGEVPTMVEVAKELKKIQRSSQKASSSST